MFSPFFPPFLTWTSEFHFSSPERNCISQTFRGRLISKYLSEILRNHFNRNHWGYALYTEDWLRLMCQYGHPDFLAHSDSFEQFYRLSLECCCLFLDIVLKTMFLTNYTALVWSTLGNVIWELHLGCLHRILLLEASWNCRDKPCKAAWFAPNHPINISTHIPLFLYSLIWLLSAK